MNPIKLSKRLHKVSEYVTPGETILDIGSDHAYLPIYLIQQDIVPKAIASEVAPGPLQNAKQKISNYALEDQISVRFGNGLEVLEKNDGVGTISICGMGGLLIQKILETEQLHKKYLKEVKFVLQPNNAEYILRDFLMNEQYQIIDEEIIEENNKIYEIIVAEYSHKPVKYSETEKYFGPELLKKESEIFIKKWKQELEKNKAILKQVKHSKNTKKINAFQKKIQKIKKVIS